MAISPSSQFYDPRIDLYQDYADQKRRYERENMLRQGLYDSPLAQLGKAFGQSDAAKKEVVANPYPPEPNTVLLLTGEDE